MIIELSFWQAVSLAVSFLGFAFGAGKILFYQFEKRMAESFADIKKRGDQTNARIDELDKSLAAMKSDTSGHLRHTDLSSLYGRLNEMDGKLNQMIGEFRSHGDTLKLFMSKITEKGLS